MYFEITHEFDAPLDVVELAVLSRDLGSMLAQTLANGVEQKIERVETVEHEIKDGAMRRVLRFQASAPLPILRGLPIPRDAMSWDEHATYRIADHASDWEVSPRERYRSYFKSSGTYRLERVPDGRTRRRVTGEIEVKASFLSGLVERMALAEVKRTYDAEAETLRRLATL